MTVGTVTPYAPPSGVELPDPGILRPDLTVAWSTGTGPFDVQIQVDDDPVFGSPLIDNTDNGVTSPHTFTPGADLGLPGPWYWRARVRDSSTTWSDWTAAQEIGYFDPVDRSRFLYLLADVGVGFTPKDDPAGGWGPAPDAVGPDGDNLDQLRYLYLLADVGVGFDPTDTPASGWDPEGIGNPLIGPGDGETETFGRYLYALANVDTSTPTPHIWYVFPSFGREGWEFRVVGYGFGDTQGTYSGSATLNGLAVTILSWEAVAASGADLAIDPTLNIAEPVHQLIRATVPNGGSSGLIVVCTDGP